MRGRKKIMTGEEHALAAGYLQAAYIAALRGETYSINIFGRRNVITRHARRAVKELLRAKSAGDDQFFADNPSAQTQDTPYFGNSLEVQNVF